jgi:hypothetical protein
MNRVRDYLVIVVKLWSKHLAGPAFAVFSLVLLAIQKSFRDAPALARAAHWGAWITLSMALLLVFVAQYDAWSLERARYEEEASKSERPRILGEASNFRLTGHYGSNDGKPYGDFSCDLYLCNDSPRATNFQGFELDGSMLTPPVNFSHEELTALTRAVGRPPVNVTGQYLGNGIAIHLAITFTAVLETPWAGPRPSIRLEPLRVSAIDGFRGKHAISVRDGETLSWDSN